jgi:hypothetical protein
MLLNSLSEEDRREVGEDEGLNGCYQQLQEEHEDREAHRYRNKGYTGHRVEVREDEDQQNDAQDNGMSRENVREQTNGQGRGLDQQVTQHLDRHQNELDTGRYAGRVENMAPEITVGFGQHHHKENQGEQQSYRDIAGEVETEGQQTQQVIDPDKKEQGQQQGHELHIALTQIGFGHIVLNETDHRLQCVLESGRRGLRTVAAVFFGHIGHQHQQDDHGKEQTKNILGNADVERRAGIAHMSLLILIQRTGGIRQVDLAFVELEILSVALHHRMTVVKGGTHKHVEAAVDQDHGKRNGNMGRFRGFFIQGKQVPVVRVADMTEDFTFDIQTLFLTLVRGSVLFRPQNPRGEDEGKNGQKY